MNWSISPSKLGGAKAPLGPTLPPSLNYRYDAYNTGAHDRHGCRNLYPCTAVHVLQFLCHNVPHREVSVGDVPFPMLKTAGASDPPPLQSPEEVLPGFQGSVQTRVTSRTAGEKLWSKGTQRLFQRSSGCPSVAMAVGEVSDLLSRDWAPSLSRGWTSSLCRDVSGGVPLQPEPQAFPL